ncbi:BTAD domain-containing putative transcriptional regulator [Kutzneria sp. CA-103260]|uniref:BTAD domain-containing putative transcriptional regulator n=1 Tax=Kutzneria sp. CA-103260 TaxID=2802641 RepID=UPI001BA48EE6|nr:BTAD domain-containing putative transcriptional regulator [Kutzneria sp. CA-103260]QUQ68778.1 SARP family transcriptional regulator/ATPase [Kutzneria sp. CA-103260]
MDRLRVTLLGAFQASRGTAVLAVPGARLRSLLVRLALAGGRAVEQSVLVDAIWAEDPPADPAHALQALVSRLRRALGSAGDVTQVAGGYRLDVAANDVDALRFEQLAADGRDRLHADDPNAAATVLGEAVTMWGDRPGAEPTLVAAVAPAVAARLAHLSIEAVADLAAVELSLGRADAAADRLTALLAEYPVHERATALLMDAFDAQGRQAEALARYERVREALADDLGADPGAVLQERHLRLLRAERPATGLAPRTLPAPLTSFIGRDDDLARIDTLLTGGRLVTVLGPGGAGKTRLAVEAARRNRDGAWMIDLASVTEPAKVTAAVLAGIGLRGGAMFEARRRVEGTELDILADQLGSRESLLLVDNCEHLIDAVAHLVAALLSRCPGLRVLATSREPLAVDGEALVPLGPLALPGRDDGVEQAQRTAAVRLFAERAAAVRPGFAVDETTLPDIIRVVLGLDGMPLALELAAARLRTLSLPDLANGLSDRFRLLTTGSRTARPRHRTLHAVIAWSWDLLNDVERTVAERVSILPGGVTLASAIAVCAGTTVPAADVPELLAGLVDRSLLQLAPDPGRYRMLETLREYGIERLSEKDALDAVRDLAVGYFTELLTRSDAELRGPGQLSATRVISAEYDNVLAALRRRCDTGDADGAVTLALRLTWYWQMFGRQADAAYWLGEALAVPGGERSPDRDCARAIHLFNLVDSRASAPAGQGADDRARAHELAAQLLGHPELPGPYAALSALPLAFLRQETAARTIIERLIDGDGWLSGLARMFRAELAENAGDLDAVRTDVAAALTCFRESGDHWGQAAALPMRAQLRQYDGDLDGAVADLREAQSLAAEFGSLNAGDRVFSQLRWIDLHLLRGETDQAIAMIESARERELPASGEMQLLFDAREAGFRLRLGDLGRARELLDATERTLRGYTAFPSDHVATLVGAARCQLCLELGDPAGAEKALASAYAAGVRAWDMPILSLVAVGAAGVADAYGQHHESAVLLGAASRLRGAHDRTNGQVRELVRRGEAALGTEAFAAAYGEGWRLDGDTAATAVDPARLRRHP